MKGYYVMYFLISRIGAFLCIQSVSRCLRLGDISMLLLIQRRIFGSYEGNEVAGFFVFSQ